MNRSGIDANESVAHRSSGVLPLNYLQRYGLAVVSIGVALGISLLLQHFGFRVPSALLLLFAVAISSWYAGAGPAVLAVILSTIGFYWYFVEPVRTIDINRSEIPYFVIFTAFAALLSWFGTVRRRGEAALREQAALLNLTHDTVFVMDMEGVIKYWNRGAEERYGWTADQAMGRVVHDLLRTVFPAPLEEINAELTRTGRWEGELLHTKKDGSQLVAASRWSLERGKRGEPVAILETNNDITERKRAEEALRRLNRELRALSNCNQTLLRATDEQSLLKEMCRIVCEEAGYGMAWVGYAEHDEAKSVRSVACTRIEERYIAALGITWADAERGRGITGTAIRSGKTCCAQDLATDPRVEPWHEISLQNGFHSAIAVPLKDEQGNAFGSLNIFSEQPHAFTAVEIRLLEELAGDLAFGIVTLRSQAARKEAEQALRQSEAYLAESERLTHAGSWALDLASAKYIYVSKEDYQIWGFDPREGLPGRETILQRIHPDDRERWKHNFENSLSRKTDSSDEYRIVLPDGTIKYLRTIWHPVLNSAGEIVRLVGTTVDITERKRAEESLRQSETYLAEAQMLSHTGSFAFDVASNKYVYISEECFRIFELDPQRSLPSREAVSRLIHSDDYGRAQADFDKLLRDKVDTPSEFRILLPSGAVKHIQVIRHPVLNEAREVVTIVGTAMNITERKRADEALRLANAYDRGLIEASLDPLVTIGPDGKITDVNAATESATGRLRGALIGTDFCDYFTEPENARAGYEQVFREGLVRDYPLDLRHRDGHVMSVSYNATVYRDELGEVVGVFAAARDITERKRAEETLRRTAVYLADAQRLTHTGSWALDGTGQQVYWSEEVFRIWGFDPQRGVPTRDQAVQRIHPEDLEKYWKYWQAVYSPNREKIGLGLEFRIVSPGGTVKHLHGTAHPVLNGNGDVVEVVGVTTDITERKRAEEALRESETRFRTFVDHAADALCVLDEKRRIIDANREACQSSGYTREELIGKVPQDFDPDVDAAMLQRIDDQIAAGEVCTFETRNRRRDGTLFPVEVRVRGFQHGGRRLHLVLARDISERKRAEEALRRSEAYLAEAQRLTHTGSWALDAASREYTYWSDEMFRIFGVDPRGGIPIREAMGRRIHPEDASRATAGFEKSLREKVDTSDEHRFQLLDGTVKHIQSIRHPVLNDAGDVVQLVGTFVDITERKAAEEALRESETRFRRFVDHAGDALFVQDIEQGTIVDVNREACESLGYTRRELIGKTPLAFHVDSDRAEIEGTAERPAGETAFDRHWHRRKDGSTFPVEDHTSLVSYGGRRFLLKVARDMSDRVRAEEQRDKLRQLEAELAHMDRVSILGELAASIAHEVNQPLSGIVSSGSACLRWLAADPPNLEEVRDSIRRIVGAGTHAGEVIARIRALTKRTEAPKEKLDLNETIREVLLLLGNEAKANNVRVRTLFADGLSHVLGDRIQLQQVLLNLVINAIEAMSSVSERGRELVITTRNIDPEQVQVTVEDSGIGMDPNAMQKIFDPFYTTKSTGTGMGLSISSSILQQHGGRLWATANHGPGACFHFAVPKYHEEELNAGAA